MSPKKVLANWREEKENHFNSRTSNERLALQFFFAITAKEKIGDSSVLSIKEWIDILKIKPNERQEIVDIVQGMLNRFKEA